MEHFCKWWWWWWWWCWNKASNSLSCVMLRTRYDESLWCVMLCEQCLETMKKVNKLWNGGVRKWFHKNSVTWRKWPRHLVFGQKHEQNSIWRMYVSKKFTKHSTLGGNGWSLLISKTVAPATVAFQVKLREGIVQFKRLPCSSQVALSVATHSSLSSHHTGPRRRSLLHLLECSTPVDALWFLWTCEATLGTHGNHCS